MMKPGSVVPVHGTLGEEYICTSGKCREVLGRDVKCKCGGYIIPDIVYPEDTPHFNAMKQPVEADFGRFGRALMVIGTTLKVGPVNKAIGWVDDNPVASTRKLAANGKDVVAPPRLLVNDEKVGTQCPQFPEGFNFDSPR